MAREDRSSAASNELHAFLGKGLNVEAEFEEVQLLREIDS
jgi:hypothetical protein